VGERAGSRFSSSIVGGMAEEAEFGAPGAGALETEEGVVGEGEAVGGPAEPVGAAAEYSADGALDGAAEDAETPGMRKTFEEETSGEAGSTEEGGDGENEGEAGAGAGGNGAGADGESPSDPELEEQEKVTEGAPPSGHEKASGAEESSGSEGGSGAGGDRAGSKMGSEDEISTAAEVLSSEETGQEVEVRVGGEGLGAEMAKGSGSSVEDGELDAPTEEAGADPDSSVELGPGQVVQISAKERAALSKKLQVLGLGGVWEGHANYEPLQRVDPEQTVPALSRKKAVHIKEDVVAIYHGTGGKTAGLSAPGSKTTAGGGNLAFGMQSLKDPLAVTEGPLDYKALCKQLHQQLAAVSRHAGSEIQARDKEIKRLRKLCVVQQEQISKESQHIRALSVALEEVKREGIAELNEARKTFMQLERRSAEVQRQAGAATAEQERALEDASMQIVSLRAERDRLAEALGVISAVTVGGRAALRGEMPDPHTIKQEAEAAKAEGAEPLPRNPGAWLKFSYTTVVGKSKDAAAPTKPARKRAALGGRRPPARTAPYGGDGERALTALVAAVSRLHTKREDTQKQCSAANARSEKLSAALAKMRREFESVEAVVENVERETGDIKRARKLAGVAPSGVASGLSGRLTSVSSILRRVNVEFDAFQDENRRLRAQVLELDFYSKLHDKVIEVGREVSL